MKANRLHEQMGGDGKTTDDPVGLLWICPDHHRDYKMEIEAATTEQFTYESLQELLLGMNAFNGKWRVNDWVPSYDVRIEAKLKDIVATGSMEFHPDEPVGIA